MCYLAEKLTSYVINNSRYDEAEYNILKYGFQVGIELIICMSVNMLFAIHFHMMEEFVILIFVLGSVRSCRWYVLLDIAAYAPTHDFDLSKYPADFVVLSFYKLFGFPTGIGALLIRKDSGQILNKVYYGGGSVLQTVTTTGDHRLPTDTARRFEDGTPNFLGILSLKYGFDALREVGGIEAINRHTSIVAHYLYQ